MKQNLDYAARADIPPTVAYLDTVELFLPFLASGIRKKLEAALGRRVRIEECKSDDSRWGWRLVVQLPSEQALRVLDEIQRECRGILHRADIAFDMECRSTDWLQQHALMRWRPEGRMHEEENGTYFIETHDEDGSADIPKRPRRNIALYGDRPGKITGRHPVAHFELRFLSSDAVKRQGWHRPSDLLGIDPRALLRKHVKLVDFEMEHYIRKILRVNARSDRAKFGREKLTAAGDRYWPSRPHRIRKMLERLTQGRVQLVKDLAPGYVRRLKKIPYEVLQLPSELSWKPKPH